MFKLVSTRVQQNLLQGTSLWGADFTNNVSLSIAYNHVQLWRRLAAAPSESDMLILEDDIVPDERALLLYGKIRDSGALPQQNYILKFVNHRSIGLLGDVELRHVHRFWLAQSSFVLQKCVCRTRQSFFSSAAYLLDRQAARVLLQHYLPMQHHVDVFMHHVGCRNCTLFTLDKDVLHFSGRPSSHQTQQDHTNRFTANVKETIRNLLLTTCERDHQKSPPHDLWASRPISKRPHAVYLQGVVRVCDTFTRFMFLCKRK